MKRTFINTMLFVSFLFTGQAIAADGLNLPIGGLIHSYNKASLHGSYIYQFAGTRWGDPPQKISETGIFTADGKGHLTAIADTSIDGEPVVLHQYGTAWDCEYTVEPNGFVDLTCDNLVMEVEGITWTMMIGGGPFNRDVKFQSMGDQPGFGRVDIQGSGIHQ